MSIIHLIVNTSDVNIVIIYQPWQSPGFCNEFWNLLDEETAMPDGLFICGNINCPSSTRHIDKQLQQIINDHNLCQHVHNMYTHHITQPQNPRVSNTCGRPWLIGPFNGDHNPHHIQASSLVYETFELRSIHAININAFHLRLMASNAVTNPR